MRQGLGLFVAKFGENDYRYALSKTPGYVMSNPKQCFNDKSFSSIEDAMSFGSGLLDELGFLQSTTSFIGDFSNLLNFDDEWDNHVGDMVSF